MDQYEKFIELYNKGLTYRKIQEKLDICYSKCFRFFRKARDEGRITPRGKGNPPREKHKVTNIHRTNPYQNKYNIKHSGVYYCTVRGYGNAEKIVERLKECDWDKSQVKEIKRSVLSESV